VHKQLIAKIAVTWELCGGRELSDGAMDLLIEKLDGYAPELVTRALLRCENECKRISIADIIQRIDDGHMGPEEAWAMLPISEDQTVVWTAEMCAAWNVARVVESDVARRMAFKEAYQRYMQESRDSYRPAVWTVSLGHDKAGRARPIIEAVEKGRLPAAYVQRTFPELSEVQALVDRNRPALPAPQEASQLPGDTDPDRPTQEEVKELVEGLGRRPNV
jgi:hypothetical protein